MKMEELLQLIEAVSASKLTELKYEENGTKLSLKKEQQKIQIVPDVVKVPEAEHGKMSIQESGEIQREEENLEREGGELILSPLVGTFYAAPAEDAEPYVCVGDRVEAGQVVGIVEAMKLMNEIESECTGTITEILVENGEPVEYGQPLFRVEV